MISYYCTTCGRHLFNYERDGTFRIMLPCKKCQTLNDISFGNVFITTTTYGVVESALLEVQSS